MLTLDCRVHLTSFLCGHSRGPGITEGPWASRGSDGKEPACDARDPGLIPGLGRYLREGNSNPLQYSCLENSMDRGAWQATVHGVA